MVRVSVIIPVYNSKSSLQECVDSIINQHFKEWELILIDDGSTDGSGEMCDAFLNKDSRIHVVHTTNQGPSSARNQGISNSIGDFLTFVDSDDYVLPSFLDNFSFDPELDFEIQGFHLRYLYDSSKDKDIKPRATRVASVGEIYAEAEHNKLSRGPVCKLFKRSIIIDNGIEYPLGVNFAEDAIFVKRYLVHCNGKARSISVADYIYNHNQSSNSLTSKRHPGQMMYNATRMDYELFRELEQTWPEVSTKVKTDYYYIRALEFYHSVCLFLTEKEQSLLSCRSFIQKAKDGLFREMKSVSNLPPTYSFVKATLFLPTSIAVVLLRLFFLIKKPNI